MKGSLYLGALLPTTVPLAEGLGQRRPLVEGRPGRGLRREFVTLLLHVPGTGPQS